LDLAIRELLARLKKGLEELYGERLKGVYVFGSYGRGQADEHSDIDVLIVLDEVPHYGEEIARTSELIGRLSLESNRSISRVFASAERWREGQSMFFLNVRQEAQPV